VSFRERCQVLLRRLASAGLGRYVQLFRVPGFGYLLGTSLLARLPEGMLGLAITLLVARNGSYARAGVVVAVYVAGSALAGPALGSLVDRVGRPVVLLPASLAEAAALCALALLPGASTIMTLACALAAGLCTPPVVAAARSRWSTAWRRRSRSWSTSPDPR
jgi:MFS family permease